MIKLLLTSAGVKNPSIHNALVEMLDKPIADCTALAISTSSYGMSNGALRAWQFFAGQATTPMCELGWKSVGVLELTALPSLGEAFWHPLVQAADVLLVNGGDPIYLARWMRKSGLADLLPSLNIVYVGLSAGSLIMAPYTGKEFAHWTQPTEGDEPLGFVDFTMFPHLDHEMLPRNTTAHAEQWADGLKVPGYAMDDETAIQVVDGRLEVISEGNWKLFTLH